MLGHPMMRHELERTFTLSRLVFQPAPTDTNEEARRVHRLRIPLHYDGEDQSAVLDFAAQVRGEDLLATVSVDDGLDAVRARFRLENAGIRLPKGSGTPSLTIGLLLESEDVDPIAKVLEVSVRAARAEGTVTVSLELAQARLPGMSPGPSLEEERVADELDASAREERATGGRSGGRRRRPKGSSPAPRT